MAKLSRKDTAYRIDALAETFGVKERLEQRAWMLSSGEQQRVSLGALHDSTAPGPPP